jgi:hypothetical protein
MRILAGGVLLLALWLPLAAQAPAGEAAAIQPPSSTHRFPIGETYVYDVDWRLWDAGTATLRMEAAGREMRVIGAADSTGAVALLYRVHDRFESSFDPRTFCSHLVRKRTEEGARHRDTLIRFDAARHKAVLEEKNLKTGGTKHAENDIPACATDVVSAIFYVASLPLAPNATYSFPLNDGNATVNVEITVEAREEVTTPAGTFRTVRVQPQAATGALKDRGRLWVWYTDDAQRVPVQMRARMTWGTLTFRLQRIDKR